MSRFIVRESALSQLNADSRTPQVLVQFVGDPAWVVMGVVGDAVTVGEWQFAVRGDRVWV